MKKDIEWLEKEVIKISENWTEDIRGDFARGLDRAVGHTIKLIGQLDEPEVLSQEWIDEHKKHGRVSSGIFGDSGLFRDYVLVKDLEKEALLVPKQEVTREQVVEWIENNEFYCHATAETVLENAVDKGELGYYGTKYSVVEKEPETVASVIADFYKSFERFKEVISMEVEELEE